MSTIYKYQLTGTNTLNLGEGYKFLHVGEQNGEVYLWAAVDPMAEPLSVTFVIVGTGQNIPADYPHIGTVQMNNGLVWHIFHTKNAITGEL